MISIRPISIRTICGAADELKKIGLSSDEAERLAAETLCLHLKVEGVPETVIPVLKDMARGLRVCVILPQTPPDPSGQHDLLLSGKASQMEDLAAALDAESADLHRISLELRNLLKNMGKTRFAIPCRTRTLELGDKTLIMGALNVTPDSFSDGGAFFQQDRALARALEMVEEGVDIIDIGGESTRPGARPIDPQEELSRILPVVKDLANQTDTPISVDTRKAEVARGVLEAGGQIINDISALRADPEMAKVIASHQVPVVLMHMCGTPETMQENIHYVSLVSDIIQYLKQSIDMASMAGVDLERIIIDPGIGFGKTVDHNLAIIKHLYQFKTLGRPILVGPSRKSFIGKILDLDADQREEGTMASIAASILNGAHIVRVHNVRNAIRVSRIADAIKAVSIPEE
jgi:dihydropteroate synthase